MSLNFEPKMFETSFENFEPEVAGGGKLHMHRRGHQISFLERGQTLKIKGRGVNPTQNQKK